MRHGRKAVTALTAALMFIGGGGSLAFYLRSTSLAFTGSTAQGSIYVFGVTTSAPLVLDEYQQVELAIQAIDQTMSVKRIVVSADKLWDLNRCGSADNLKGAEAVFSPPLKISRGEALVIDESNAPGLKIKLVNDPAVNQTKCRVYLKAQVN